MKLLKALGLLLLWGLPFSQAYADEFRPALLEITENSPGWYAVTWKVPLKNGRALPLQPQLPEQLTRVGPLAERRLGDAIVEQSSWQSEPGALVGGTLAIAGLKALPIEVIVQIDLVDGTEHSAILRSSSPSYRVPEQSTGWMVAGSYWKIGTIHILEGFDHLLFVLALILIVPGWWMLLKTITAFTLAHSVTLALATLGLVNLPGPPTEAVIALSILFLAVEIVHSREGRVTLTERYPWLVALSFGLVHGLGFAGALSEVGLPQADIPLALLMFNIGVESGQLLFVGLVVVIREVLQRSPVTLPANGWRLLPYVIGSIASFWIFERVASFA